MCANLKHRLLLWSTLYFQWYTASETHSKSHTLANNLKLQGFFSPSPHLRLWFKQFLYREQRRLSNGYILLLRNKKCLTQPTVIKNIFTTRFYRRKANIVTFKKCIVLLLGSHNEVYLCPSLTRWPWWKIIRFSAPCFHLLQNGIQYCP